MEFRCEACQHVGAAAGTKSDAAGVLLICENCSHENRLTLGPQTSGAAPPPKTQEAQTSFVDETFDRFLPSRADGERCPKCAHVAAQPDQYCARCGLNLETAHNYAPGEAPWERPPPGRESEWEQGRLLWQAFESSGDADSFSRFSDFIRENELHDMAARLLRFYLIDHPDDQNALTLLREIAGSVHTRMMVAQAQALANTAEFSDVTQRARNVLLWTAFLFWLVILMVIVTRYMC